GAGLHQSAGLREGAGLRETAEAPDLPSGPGGPEGSNAPAPHVSVVAVGLGAGFAEIYRSLGADEVIPAGGDAKPSVGELAAGLERAPAPSVLALPCHPDVELSLKQAAALSGKEVHIIP